MNIEQLKSLQARIRNSTGPDRELDCDIYRALGFEVYAKKLSMISEFWFCSPGAVGQGLPVRRITASLDACVALQSSVLPESRREVIERWGYDAAQGGWVVSERLVKIDTHSVRPAIEIHALETHAHLLAIFAAVIAREEAKETEKTV